MISSVYSFLLNDCAVLQRASWQRAINSQTFAEQAAAASSGRKVATYTPAYDAPIPKMGPNELYGESDCSGQSTGIEYTEDSTEEDPIVRIRGVSWSGEYDYTIHINDIDARNATYPELCALVQHQAKTEGYQQMGRKYALALPDEMDRGDYSKRQDFTQSLRGCISKNQRYNPNVAALAKNLLSMYENFAAEHADKVAEKVTRAAEQKAAVDRAIYEQRYL